MRVLGSVAATSVLLFAACGDGGDDAPLDASTGVDAAVLPSPAENWNRDLLSTDLTFDVGIRRATATITFAGDDSRTASLSVGDLVIDRVHTGDVDLLTERTGDRLDIGIPDDGSPIAVTIDYSYSIQSGFEGYMSSGVTLVWPYWCGNLFPCKTDPADGLTFTMEVTGMPDGTIAIYPETIPADAPSYMPAFAIGTYSYIELGTTAAGTEVGVYHLPDGEASALSGTDFLVEYVDFLERTYGDYTFGPKIASVAARWGPGSFGGMEHHPYFHVASGAMSARDIQAHEAAHGWFGNGVRIACWEDFVLSEGLAEYLMARAVEDAEGVTAGDALWADLQTQLESAVASEDTVAYPTGCNEIDILSHPLWSRIPYEKGAFFMRAVEQRVGRAALDTALANFYTDNVGKARHMSDLIDAIEADTGEVLDDLVDGWLTGLGIP